MTQQIPSELVTALRSAEGFSEENFLAIHASGEQVVSVRMNPRKTSPALMEQIPMNLVEGKVPWSTHGYYLRSRPSFTLDPLFHGGAYYVQEASSMFLEQALRQCCHLEQPLRVLDLCAAPGGKSTLIQSLISEDSLLVSNELIKGRANILAENITKWGAANVVVTNNAAKDFQKLPGFFDVIVVDAPCSGSGLFRKDPQAIDEWSVNNVILCRDRQLRILDEVMSALKPGGTLIYSTCSFSIEEDEQICDWLIANYPLVSAAISVDESWAIVETCSKERGAFGYRFYPDKVKGEGFFLAVFHNVGQDVDGKEGKPKSNSVVLQKSEQETASRYIQNPGIYAFLKWNDMVLAMRASVYPAFLRLQANLYLKKAGVNLGTIVRDQLVPDHELALSTIVSDAITSIEVGEDLALDFLRRKDIKINTDANGWAMIKYRHCTLGLVKILPNRVNNYYPREWRILNM